MSDIATTQAFQERMFAKIRDQMGDLMTDDDLRKLVDAAMQKAFFEPRTESNGHYGTKQVPPLFVVLITDLMREEVAKAVTQWVRDHPKDVSASITAAIEKGVAGMVMASFESRVFGPLQTFDSALRAKGLL